MEDGGLIITRSAVRARPGEPFQILRLTSSIVRHRGGSNLVVVNSCRTEVQQTSPFQTLGNDLPVHTKPPAPAESLTSLIIVRDVLPLIEAGFFCEEEVAILVMAMRE